MFEIIILRKFPIILFLNSQFICSVLFSIKLICAIIQLLSLYYSCCYNFMHMFMHIWDNSERNGSLIRLAIAAITLKPTAWSW